MPPTERCSECGGSLPPYWPKGLCPSCALNGALDMSHAESLVVAREPLHEAAELPPSGVPTENPPLGSFGDYDLLEEIGRGGMGVVFKARQRKLGRIVAVKMMVAGPLTNQEFIRRFRGEAAAAAVLQHPNIIGIHDVGVHDGRHFFSMDYVAGKNLTQLVGQQPLSPGTAARYVEICAAAIHYAHENGILHRDLKPSNVLIDAHDQPRIMDFGLAKQLDGESTLTIPGQVLGSPNFMPPEQTGMKHGKVGRHSDVYTLGGVLYYLLTGRAPFHADSLGLVIRQVIEAEPVSPRLFNPSLPKDVVTITLRCLEKVPSRRYATAKDLADDLARFQRHEPIHARPLNFPEKLWRWSRRKPVIASLLVLLLIVSTGGLGGILWQWQRAERHAERAEAQAYASDINLTQQALSVNNLGLASDLLNRHRPAAGQVDRRGWEWRYLWQHAQSDELFTLCQKPASIFSLAVSPDGRLLAVGERNRGHVTLWDVPSRRQVAQLPEGTRPDTLYLRVAFSPIEPLLAYGYATTSNEPAARLQCRVRIWDYHTQKEVAEYPLDFLCSGLAFSPDGKSLVTSTPTVLTRWDVQTGAKLTSYPLGSHQGIGTPFSIAPDFRFVAQAFGRGQVRVMDLTTGKALWTGDASPVQIEAVAISNDGRFVATAGANDNSVIHLREASDGRLISRFDQQPGGVIQLLFSLDNRTLISANTDQTIRIWDVSNPASIPPPRALVGHSLEVWRLALLPDGKTLISGGKDGSVRFWDLTRPPRTHGPIELPGGPFATWSFAENESDVLTCDRRGRIARWSGLDWQTSNPLLDTKRTMESAYFLPDRRQLATPGNDGALHIFGWSDSAPPRALPVFPRGSWIWSLRRHANRLAVGRLDQPVVHDYDVNTWERVQSWPAPVPLRAMDFTPDGKYCIMVAARGQVLVRNLITAEESSFGDGLPNITNVSFSTFGDRLAIACEQGFVGLWETGSWRTAGALRGFRRDVHGISFSPDGQRLAAGSSGREAVRVYEMNQYQPLLSLDAQGTGYLPVFNASNTILGAINAEGNVRLWRAPTWREIETAEQAVVH